MVGTRLARIEQGVAAVINGSAHCTDAELSAAIRGKTVLISGASFGIGEATARRVASCGATVLILARSADKLRAVAEEIRQAGGDAHAYPVDLTAAAEVDALVETVLREHGHVDVLINNAGKSIRRSMRLTERRFTDIERTININYLAPARLTLALLPSMRARKAGQVISVATWGVRFPPAPRWSAYIASKTAFDVWFRTFGQEVRSAGITTSSVYMGLVHTRMSAPTGGLRRAPGLTPEQAAGVLCAAIVHRKRKVEAPWIGVASVLLNAMRGPFEYFGAATYPYGDDTASAKAAVLGSPTPQDHAR